MCARLKCISSKWSVKQQKHDASCVVTYQKRTSYCVVAAIINLIETQIKIDFHIEKLRSKVCVIAGYKMNERSFRIHWNKKKSKRFRNKCNVWNFNSHCIRNVYYSKIKTVFVHEGDASIECSKKNGEQIIQNQVIDKFILTIDFKHVVFLCSIRCKLAGFGCKPYNQLNGFIYYYLYIFPEKMRWS